jgi:hypothetical protein
MTCDGGHYDGNHKDNNVLSPEASSAILKLEVCKYLIPIEAVLDCFGGETRHGGCVKSRKDVERKCEECSWQCHFRIPHFISELLI